MADDKAHDVERIVVEAFKGRVRETEDDCEDGAGDIAQDGSPERRQRPVLATANDGVKIVPKLVTLRAG